MFCCFVYVLLFMFSRKWRGWGGCVWGTWYWNEYICVTVSVGFFVGVSAHGFEGGLGYIYCVGVYWVIWRRRGVLVGPGESEKDAAAREANLPTLCRRRPPGNSCKCAQAPLNSTAQQLNRLIQNRSCLFLFFYFIYFLIHFYFS